jgi:hypothetical protein
LTVYLAPDQIGAAISAKFKDESLLEIEAAQPQTCSSADIICSRSIGARNAEFM